MNKFFRRFAIALISGIIFGFLFKIGGGDAEYAFRAGWFFACGCMWGQFVQ